MANAMIDNAMTNAEARTRRMQELCAALEKECDSFGLAVWNDADIITALTMRGVYPTAEKIAAIKENYHVRHLDDQTLVLGWNCIHTAISDLELTRDPLVDFKPALGRMYQPYGEDWEDIKLLDEHHVATLVKAGPREVLLTGIHFVNRVGYYPLTSPWTQEGEIVNREGK
jgi:hypothetical protein